MRSLFGERLFLPFFGRNPLRFYEPGNVFVVKRGGLRSLRLEVWCCITLRANRMLFISNQMI